MGGLALADVRVHSKAVVTEPGWYRDGQTDYWESLQTDVCNVCALNLGQRKVCRTAGEGVREKLVLDFWRGEMGVLAGRC